MSSKENIASADSLSSKKAKKEKKKKGIIFISQNIKLMYDGQGGS